MRQFDYLDFDIDDEMSGVPAGFVTAESFTLTATGERLEYAQPDTFDALTPMTGKPRFYTISGNLFVFAPTPDQTYEARLRYRARPSGLSATVSSNWILERHPDAYIYAALAESAPYLRDDDRLPMWEARRDRAIAEINDAEPRRATSLRMDDMPVRYAAFDIVRG